MYKKIHNMGKLTRVKGCLGGLATFVKYTAVCSAMRYIVDPPRIPVQ